MQDQKLMDYFKFTEEDLQANHMGQISDKQKARLAMENTSNQVGRVIGGVLLILIGLGLLALAVGSGIGRLSSFGKDSLGVWVLFILWEILWCGAGLGFFIWGIRVFGRGFQGFSVRLQRVEGPVNIVTERYRVSEHTRYRHELHVGNKTFVVDDANLANAMTQGDTYAIYYTEGSAGDILSAELISNADAFDSQSKVDSLKDIDMLASDLTAKAAKIEHLAEVLKLKKMLASGLITQQEFEQKKKQILDEISSS